MNKGVPQGESLGQSTYIRRAAQLHPIISILLVADDTHDLGTQKELRLAFLLQLRQPARMSSMASVNTIHQLSTYLYKRLIFIGFHATWVYRGTPAGSF